MTQNERQERSRGEIQKAAMAEFGTKGYNGTRMESICAGHGISKGMMYHYYSNKDELFLLCAEQVLAGLTEFLRNGTAALADRDSFEAVRSYFFMRKEYFQERPEEKRIFEDAISLPEGELSDRIRELRGPLRDMNRSFLMGVLSKMPLRPGTDQEKAVRYLESLDDVFWMLVARYCAHDRCGLHGMLEATGEILRMVMFGLTAEEASAVTEK